MAETPATKTVRHRCVTCGRPYPHDLTAFCACGGMIDVDYDLAAARLYDSPNPYVRWRTRFHAYHRARAAGWTDAEYVALVERLDAAVAAVDGHGFRVTSFARCAGLSTRLGFSPEGGVWV